MEWFQCCCKHQQRSCCLDSLSSLHQRLPSDLSMIFTTLLRLVEIAQELGQPHILVTADLAYSKAQQILWIRPKSLYGKVTMRLGGKHMIMAFLANVGNIFGDRILHDILVSSEVYTSATANQTLQVKQYARATRGIRLADEALTGDTPIPVCRWRLCYQELVALGNWRNQA